MLFHDQPKVHELVARAQREIAGQPGLDLVPIPWLHLTTFALPAEPFDALTPVLDAVRETSRVTAVSMVTSGLGLVRSG